jgi:RNA polymerase sigma factor (TIGR02999 family)
MDSGESVTGLLRKWAAGDRESLDRLIPLVYNELRRLARGYLRRERLDHTLQPTALVNEAFFRLVDQEQVSWQNRSHFFGIAAQSMRRILVDHAREHLAAKRGAGAQRVPLELAAGVAAELPVDLIMLDAALQQLAAQDERQGRVVELRFFGGLTIEETAEVVGVSPATVKREWEFARAWLRRQMVADASDYRA